MKKKNRAKALKVLPALTPIPEGFTAHPYTLLATFAAQLISVEQHFTPEAYTFTREAILQIIKGVDPKEAFRLNMRKTKERTNLRNICMVIEIIQRNAANETLHSIYKDMSENGYEWQGRKHSLGYKNIETIYGKLSPIISQNPNLLRVNLEK